jgi:hypothetical protein
MEYERTHAAAIISEKRGRNFDKVKLKHTLKGLKLKCSKQIKYDG